MATFYPNAFAPLNSIKILFLGDSLTEGFALPAKDSYPAVLEDLFRTDYGKSVTAINAGISGDTIADGLNRFRCILADKHAENANHPRRDNAPTKNPPTIGIDILFVALGTNDALRGLPVELMKLQLKTILTLGQEHGMEVVIAGTELPNEAESFYGADYLKDFAKIYVELEAEFGITRMPILQKDVANVREYNLDDGLHPNAAGYKLIAGHVAKVLLPVIEKLKLPKDMD